MVAIDKRWPRIGILAVGLILLLNGDSNVRADDKEDPIRTELLKLNQASTEEIQTAKLRALLKDREKAKKTIAEADKMMKEVKKGDEKPFKYNGTVILARAAHLLRQFDIAERFYEHQIELATKVNSGPKIEAAYEGIIELYWDSKRYADVIDTVDKVLELKGPQEILNYQPFAYERSIQAKAKQGKVDEAMTLTKRLLEAEDGSWYFLQLKGWIQREDGKLGDAITTYTEVLDKLNAEKNLKPEVKDKFRDRVRYILSGLYVDNKEIDKAAKQLELLMKANPESATYKNDLGFIWCDHDLKLEESEKLIKEALELDKKEKEKLKADGKLEEVSENAAYLDSLGWVYYKQKKFKEALEPLKKASLDEDEGNHLEIWDHLGDCYAALGQKKDALTSFEKALKMEDISNRDGERRRKVSEKLKKLRLELTKE